MINSDKACLKMDMGTYVQAAQIHAAFNLVSAGMREQQAVAEIVAKAADMIHEALPAMLDGYDLYAGDPYRVEPLLTADNMKPRAETPKAGDGAGDIQIVVSVETEKKLNDISTAFGLARMKETLRGVIHTYAGYQDGCWRNGSAGLWKEGGEWTGMDKKHAALRR